MRREKVVATVKKALNDKPRRPSSRKKSSKLLKRTRVLPGTAENQISSNAVDQSIASSTKLMSSTNLKRLQISSKNLASFSANQGSGSMLDDEETEIIEHTELFSMTDNTTVPVLFSLYDGLTDLSFCDVC